MYLLICMYYVTMMRGGNSNLYYLGKNGAFVKTGKFASSTKILYEILTFLLKISKLDFAMFIVRALFSWQV